MAMIAATLRIRQVERMPSKLTYSRNYTNCWRSQVIPGNVTNNFESSSPGGFPAPIKCSSILGNLLCKFKSGKYKICRTEVQLSRKFKNFKLI